MRVIFNYGSEHMTFVTYVQHLKAYEINGAKSN
jgi:hypothetical protein